MAKYKLSCEWCHDEFLAHRRDARYCSDRCRKSATRFRERKLKAMGYDPNPPVFYADEGVKQDEIIEAIVNLKAALATFSAGSKKAAPGYRPLCNRLSASIKTVLEREGL